MKINRLTLAVAIFTLAIYLSAIALGLHTHSLANQLSPIQSQPGMHWVPPSPREIPITFEGDRIRRGARLFNETPAYSAHAHARLSCSSCHAEGGIAPFASPVVGMPALFPQYSQRAGRSITLEDRIQECFVRSENGKPLEPRGDEMQSLLSYISWLSTPQPTRKPFSGRGLITLADLSPDPVHGASLYRVQCAGCHGNDGAGRLPVFPPLWGELSFNDGAGMYGLKKMAAFVQHNMPQNRKGILSPQDAYDVAAYIRTQPRPAMNPAYKSY